MPPWSSSPAPSRSWPGPSAPGMRRMRSKTNHCTTDGPSMRTNAYAFAFCTTRSWAVPPYALTNPLNNPNTKQSHRHGGVSEKGILQSFAGSPECTWQALRRTQTNTSSPGSESIDSRHRATQTQQLNLASDSTSQHNPLSKTIGSKSKKPPVDQIQCIGQRRCKYNSMSECSSGSSSRFYASSSGDRFAHVWKSSDPCIYIYTCEQS